MLTKSIVYHLKFASVYLNFRKQKVGSTVSDCLNILFGALQGSRAAPLFFSYVFQIYNSELSSYADENAPFP